VCEPVFDRPLKDISFGRVLLRLFQTSRRFNVEVQPQLVLLQKTLLIGLFGFFVTSWPTLINAVLDGHCYVSGRGAFPPGA
jgi:hypothetical protein